MVLEIPAAVAIESIKDAAIATEAHFAESLQTAISEAAKVTEELRSQEYMHSLKEYMANGKNGPYLTEKKECVIQKPETALAQLQDFKGNPKFKGDLGEALGTARDGLFGKVDEQVYVEKVAGFDEASRVDRVTKLEQNVKCCEVVSENGAISINDLYIPEGTEVATEVKNGSLSYLESEASGNMAKQIAAHHEIAEQSIVEINQDCYLEMCKKPEQAAKVLERINGLNSKVILGLPDINSQLEIFLGV